MSDFGAGYRVGQNAARGRQVSEQLWSALNQCREQDWALQQSQTLQAQLQAALQEIHRLRQENAELRRFGTWAIDEIERTDERVATIQSMLDVWIQP